MSPDWIPREGGYIYATRLAWVVNSNAHRRSKTGQLSPILTYTRTVSVVATCFRFIHGYTGKYEVKRINCRGWLCYSTFGIMAKWPSQPFPDVSISRGGLCPSRQPRLTMAILSFECQELKGHCALLRFSHPSRRHLLDGELDGDSHNFTLLLRASPSSPLPSSHLVLVVCFILRQCRDGRCSLVLVWYVKHFRKGCITP